MIREVIIDNQQIDIENDNAAGYIFTSPIFRDITKILSNRTTTYKIPKTQRNLNVFGLSDNPDVFSLFPYREHTFEEIRDGLPFIKGICTLLKSASDELELSVIWGNTINLLNLKDLKLRELNSSSENATIEWNSNTGFLLSSSDEQKGFLVTDFGKGTSIENSRPAVTLQYILDVIEYNTGVHFSYPERFDEVFKKTWIPLIDNTPNYYTWENPQYWVMTGFREIFTGSSVQFFSRFRYDLPSGGNTSIIENISTNAYTFIKAKANSTVNIEGSTRFRVPNLAGASTVNYKLKLYAYANGIVYAEQSFDIGQDENGFLCFARYNMSFDVSEDTNIEIRGSYTLNGVNRFNLAGTDIAGSPISSLRIYVKYNEVRFGDTYPIISNLPDLTVIDFLKTIMQMYGLFTYYDYKLDNSTIQFISIDDIYSKKSSSYNWTNKLVNTDKGRFSLSYIYGEYAQRNNFKYKHDDGVSVSADGFLTIDNQTITQSKDLVELPFSASDNVVGENNNQYAKINLFADDGRKQNISYRVVLENVYRDINTGVYYKSGIFDDSLKFGGSLGLLEAYYSAFQYILIKPMVAECYIYLNEYELHKFREVNPIYIDGVYYAPIEVTVQTNGLAVCKLIRMPGGYKPPSQ